MIARIRKAAKRFGKLKIRGATMVEYVLLISLIAIAAISALGTLGDSLRQTTAAPWPHRDILLDASVHD